VAEVRILPGLPESARAVRSFVAACLPGCPVADDAVLCADELAANAVQHSRSGLPGGMFTVRVAAQRGQWLRVEIEDAGPRLRVVPAAAESGALAEAGRGLDLVVALAEVFCANGGLRWFWMPWSPQVRASWDAQTVDDMLAIAAARSAPGSSGRPPGPSAPWWLRRRAVLDRSGDMCQCTGECGRPGHQCGHGDVPGRPLHIVAADPAVRDGVAAVLPAADLVALCASCRTGRDRSAARAAAAAAELAALQEALW
jgi:hypothetical protein